METFRASGSNLVSIQLSLVLDNRIEESYL